MTFQSPIVSVEVYGVTYTGQYEVLQGGLITVTSKEFGQTSGQLDDMPPEIVAKVLLRELVTSSPSTDASRQPGAGTSAVAS